MLAVMAGSTWVFFWEFSRARLGENYVVHIKIRFDESIIIYYILILNSLYLKNVPRGGATWYPILVWHQAGLGAGPQPYSVTKGVYEN